MPEAEVPTLSYAGPGSPARAAFTARPALFLVIEGDHPTAEPARIALENVDRLRVGRAEHRSVTRAGPTVDLAVADRWMSQAHAELRRHGDRFELVDLGSKNGSFVLGERVTSRPLTDGDALTLGHTIFVYRGALPGDGAAREAEHPAFRTLLPELAAEFAELAAVARATVPVLLSGETGTGKEKTARAIHELSRRPGKMLAVNCGAIPPGLVESELFGHRKGAFSGATQDQQGVLRAAHGGTLLLDEIGDLPLPAQAALLRALEEKEVRPVGGSAPTAIDVRFVAASHQSLPDLVKRGRFRQDLLSRLAGYAFTVPPLRTRREDLGLMVAALLASFGGLATDQVAIAPEAALRLLGHAWPHNVRELRNALERAVAIARPGTLIEVGHLPPELRGEVGWLANDSSGARAPSPAPSREELEALLTKHAGNVSLIARERDVTRMQVHRWMKRLGLDAATFRR